MAFRIIHSAINDTTQTVHFISQSEASGGGKWANPVCVRRGHADIAAFIEVCSLGPTFGRVSGNPNVVVDEVKLLDKRNTGPRSQHGKAVAAMTERLAQDLGPTPAFVGRYVGEGRELQDAVATMRADVDNRAITNAIPPRARPRGQGWAM